MITLPDDIVVPRDITLSGILFTGDIAQKEETGNLGLQPVYTSQTIMIEMCMSGLIGNINIS